MKQQCVSSNNAFDFQSRCNELLKQGWEIIPGTVFSNQTLVAFFRKGF